MPNRKKGRSLFRTILVPQFLVLVLVIVALTMSFPLSGMGEKITKNYRKVVALQTANQADYLVSYMVDNQSHLTKLCNTVTLAVQHKLEAGEITIDQLDNDSECYEKLLQDVSDELIAIVSANHVSGAYVIFNTENLSRVTQRVEKPSLFIRDLEPTTIKRLGDDLRVMRAPERVVYELLLVKDESWQPMFAFESPEKQDFFYEPFQRAYYAPAENGAYWTKEAYQLEGSDAYAMSYSVPIVLDDGRVIGVVGVELLVDHLSYFLPAGQLLESEESAYLIGCAFGDDPTEVMVIANGGEEFLHCEVGENCKITPLQIGGYGLMCGGREFFAELYELAPHGRSSEGTEVHWYLIGIVGMNEMFSFANEMTGVITMTVLLTLLVGVVSVITVSRRLARPISVLVSEVENARNGEEAVFTDTGIEEIDRLSASFRELMQETVDTSTKFLRIMEMASVELAGYEWREGSDSIYVTENFFPMLGITQRDTGSMTVTEFGEILEGIRSRLGASITLDGSRIYCINRGGNVRYVRAESSQEGERHVGLLEDVTRSTLERIRVEHERDYDVLTGLYNRRAFYNRAGQFFAAAEEMKCAALLVMDLDNLKSINDRFGHDWGDKYLCQTAQCIQENTPSSALCARISGDELYILFHGYHSREMLDADIAALMNSIRQSTLRLPNGETTGLSVSGGIAIYPDDSVHLHEMIKFADFAMYQAKGTNKGTIKAFHAEDYAKNQTFLRGRGELHKLIEQENVKYHFQPIYSAKTARPAAYEALMRVDMPSIKSPDVVLRLAAAEGSQYQIERITMFKATETYRRLLENGQVADDAMLFINSQPDQCLTDEDARQYHEEFSALQSRIVLEITEDEYLGLDALEVKRKYPGFSGSFALDDYGSGYNGEKNLLLLQPRFVKVDVVFVRGIDSNPDRQQLVSSLVTYAHGRDMQVVAEGIETAEELQKVLELGVDLFQGYFLARPAAVPGPIAPQAEEIIKSFNRE